MASSEASSSSKAASPPVEVPKKKEPLLPPHITTYFIAGGIAGAASRTVVSPLERLKIIQQVQPKRSGASAYNGVYRSLVRMWQEEGFRGFMRGNGANCIRIIPYSAVQFTAYEQLKKRLIKPHGTTNADADPSPPPFALHQFFTKGGTRELDTLTRLTSGALAGITSVTTTYPLDLVRARLSIVSASLEFAHQQAPATVSSLQTTGPSTATAPAPALSKISPSASAAPRPVPLAASLSTSAASHVAAVAGNLSKPKIPGMWDMMVLVYKEEGGIRGLYRGLVPTAVGVAPYVGINFTAYETLRIFITPPEHKNSIPRKLLCGALAGSISQTITYPLDVLRRKMQVVGMKDTSTCGVGSLGYKYNGAWDAIWTTLRTEGIQGMYRGLWPNLLKVAPSIATSFFTYELVKEALL